MSSSCDEIMCESEEAVGTRMISVSSSLLRRERMSARRVVPDLLGRGVSGGFGVVGEDDDVMVVLHKKNERENERRMTSRFVAGEVKNRGNKSSTKNINQ